MRKITASNYRTDPHYPRVVRAAATILARKDFIAPVEIFVEMDLLAKENLDRWRFGGVPYLERVIHCNLAKASRILRILRLHAHDLNLRPSPTVYVRFGKGPRPRLRFSKTGEPALENAWSLHFVAAARTARPEAASRPGTSPQPNPQPRAASRQERIRAAAPDAGRATPERGKGTWQTGAPSI